MLINLLSTSNYISFNSKIAEVLGLHEAIYLSEIMNINDKALRKNKVDGTYFTVDRNYIKSRTTLDVDEQLEIEKELLSIGVLEKSEQNGNTISLNITTLTSILASPDENFIKDVSKLVKAKKTKRTKTDVIIDNLKKRIKTTNAELRFAYEDWIDSVYAKQGWMSAKAVDVAETLLDNFTLTNNGHDLDLALKILEIASVSGYRDLQWAINTYKDNFNVSYKIKNSATKKIDVDRVVELSEEGY